MQRVSVGIETFSLCMSIYWWHGDQTLIKLMDYLPVAIEQKTTSKSPRSTVGTITELYDFSVYFMQGLQMPIKGTQELMVQYSDDEIVFLFTMILIPKSYFTGTSCAFSKRTLSRIIFNNTKQGFTRVRVDGEFVDLKPGYKVDRYKIHDIEIVIDRLLINRNKLSSQKQLKESLQTAMYHGKDTIILWGQDSKENRFFSRKLMCPSTGIAYPSPEPNSFSFNPPSMN